jgi:hypothetical protein
MAGAPLPVREYADVADMMAHVARIRGQFWPEPPVRNLIAPAPLKAWARPAVTEAVPELPDLLWPHTGHSVLRVVCIVTKTLRRDIEGVRRSHKIVRPRQIACWAVRHYTKLSLPQIGMMLGDRDHTTVLHAHRKVQSVIDHFDLVVSEDVAATVHRIWSADWSQVPR